MEHGLGIARVAIRDAVEVQHPVRSGRSAGRPRRRRAAAEAQRSARSQVVSGIAQSRCRRPGRLNARDSSARLRSSTSVSDTEDDRPDHRQQPAHAGRRLPSVSRPRARWLSPMTWHARRASARPRWSPRPRTPRAGCPGARGRRRTPAVRSSARTSRWTARSRRGGRGSGPRSRRLRRSRRRARSEQDRRPGSGEDADKHDRDGDRQGQQQRTSESAHDARAARRERA